MEFRDLLVSMTCYRTSKRERQQIPRGDLMGQQSVKPFQRPEVMLHLNTVNIPAPKHCVVTVCAENLKQLPFEQLPPSDGKVKTRAKSAWLSPEGSTIDGSIHESPSFKTFGGRKQRWSAGMLKNSNYPNNWGQEHLKSISLAK